MSKNIVLVGLSGSGKTTIGKLLQKVFSDFILVDTDEIIVNKEKRTINDIFAIDGEQYFRSIEAQVAKEVSEKENQIISTGGGIVLNGQNIAELKKNGIIFYLKTSPETLINRLKGDDTRPLLKTDDIRKKLVSMLEIRGNLYEKADFTVITDNQSENETAQEIARIYNERSNG